MKFPRLFFADHDAQLADLRERCLVAESRFDLERAERIASDERHQRRYDDLLTAYQAVVAPKPVGAYTLLAADKPEPSAVSKVIREQAMLHGRVDPALSAHLRGYAKQLKDDGLSEDEIVGKLVVWHTSETVGLEG